MQTKRRSDEGTTRKPEKITDFRNVMFQRETVKNRSNEREKEEKSEEDK